MGDAIKERHLLRGDSKKLQAVSEWRGVLWLLIFFRGPLKWAAFRRLRTDGGGFWATDGTGLQDGWLAEEDTNRGMKKGRGYRERRGFS